MQSTDDRQVPLPLGISPNGTPLNSVKELPELPLPKAVIVGTEFMWVDGWTFRAWPICKAHLEWLVRQACRWCAEDPSPENRAQVSGLMEAIEKLVKSKEPRSKLRGI